jgi:hypothetical protein
MDDKVTAVLAAYDERMREESAQMRSGATPGGGADWRDRVLLAVGPETGQLINILARSLTSPNILELGTSYGYSGIWLAEAARATGGRLTTIELQDYKSAYAREMSVKAGLAEHVDFKVGDAVETINALTLRHRLRPGRPLEGPLHALPRGLLSEAQSGRDHRRRQHDPAGRRRRAPLCRGGPRQARRGNPAGPRRLRPGNQPLPTGLIFQVFASARSTAFF